MLTRTANTECGFRVAALAIGLEKRKSQKSETETTHSSLCMERERVKDLTERKKEEKHIRKNAKNCCDTDQKCIKIEPVFLTSIPY